MRDSRPAPAHPPLPFGATKTFREFHKEEIEQSLPDRFEQQVARYPDRLAIKTRRCELTYEALNREANRIAHAILALRGTSEEPVALSLGNDASMVAALVAVLKAGKTYVPLEPSAASRTADVLRDSQAEIIVTDNQNRPAAAELAVGKLALLNIDTLDSGLPIGNPGLSISPDALAWILYTSGSTGQPKGVVQNHRNILHFVRNYTNYLHLCADDRVCLLMSLTFNGSNHEIFSALLNGASLHRLDIKTEGVAPLAPWLIERQITVYCSVPTLFRHFLDTLTGDEKFPDLRLIKMIGEPVYARDVQRFQQHFSDECIFVNRLGATEVGTIRWFFFDKSSHLDGHLAPVGYPVEDNEILLLDEERRPVVAGDTGEIAVRSRYLSPGYWRRRDRTREVFLPDPDGGDQRIYLTGDLGSLKADGCLFHMGRKDFQVKIRGHRIETAEVELALLELDGIKNAAVVARPHRFGDQCLVAYVVPQTPPAPSVSRLREHLAKRLPGFMIPSSFVALEALPLTSSGKTDRRALPAPDFSRPALDSEFVGPRTPLEGALAGIWSEILGIDAIGIHDNFFDLGGHSLLASQAASRVHDALHLEVPLRYWFDNPTVATLAAAILQVQAQRLPPEELSRALAKIEEHPDEERVGRRSAYGGSELHE